MLKGHGEEVVKIYENLRDEAVKSLEKRREEIKNLIPEVITIENKIAKLSIDLSLNILRKKDNIDKIIENTKEEITDLRMRKSELLVSRNYPIDYLDFHYNCDKCKDTGFIGRDKCQCYKQILVKVLYKNSELSNMLERNNFSNFTYHYFSDIKSPNEPESPRKNLEKIADLSWSFIENFSSSQENLLFFGDSGTGKSFLASCIAKELLDRGYMVIYKTAVDLIKDIKQSRFGGEEDLENLLIDCDLLIIDDLGTEPLNEFSKVELFNLLNTKLLKRKKMIISTNFSIEFMLKNYSERTTSRLFGNFTLCKFFGEDIRVKLNTTKRR
ncbi:ATP-binding protein [Clostridium malenominatum]|uniref:ATP-binding protein n=1 Tax=Clostridium malenominatum TaxID=1539 RepID=A0ABP3U7T1_9CLOT